MSFQSKVVEWMKACFGEDDPIAHTVKERSYRFTEEAIELMQATGVTLDEVQALAEWVYNRPPGEVHQEVGGVMTTLAGLCHARGLSIEAEQWKELTRCWANKERIRAKNEAKRARIGGADALPGMPPEPVPIEDRHVPPSCPEHHTFMHLAAIQPTDESGPVWECLTCIYDGLRERAWELYSVATEANPYAAQSWDLLPVQVQQEYIEKARTRAA